MVTLNVIVLCENKQLIEKLFPEEDKENKEIRYNHYHNNFNNFFEFLKKKKKSYKWRAMTYPELNVENSKQIRNKLKNYFEKEEKNIKKNVIIIFGDNEIKKIIKLINDLEQTKRPLILFVSKNKGDYSRLSDIRLATFLKMDDDEEKTYNKIISYLWEKDCYFNERGNITCRLSEANLFYKKPKGFTSLKILLIGLKRSGKSTLINIISKKLTAFELPNDQSITKTITEYDIYPFEEEEKNNISCIKFYDSPGIEKTEIFDSESIVIDFLKNKFDEINLIYFVKRDGGIEDCKNVFDKIVSLNNKRKEKGLAKVPIIFIINGNINIKEEKSSVAINTVKDYLINHYQNELYDDENDKNKKSINGTKKNAINDDNSDSDSDDDDENYKNKKYIDGNIIKVNLRKQEDDYSFQKIYGIDILLTKTIEYLKKTNSLKENELNELKKINKEFVKLFIDDYKGKKYDKEKYKLLIEQSKELVSKLMKENSLLMSMPILHDYYEKKKFIFLIAVGIVYTLFILGVIMIIIGIHGLVKGYILQIALEYGFDEKDIEDYQLGEFVFDNLEEKDEKNIKKKIEGSKDFFEKLLKFTNGSQLVIKSFEVYQNIFKSLEKLRDVKNEQWNNFNENII